MWLEARAAQILEVVATMMSMQRRVRPWKEVMRRLRKGGRAEAHGTARRVATRAATAAARRRRLSGTGVGSVMRRATRAAR